MGLRLAVAALRFQFCALLTAGLVVLAAPSALAQLGETAETCAKLFGASVKQIPAVMEGGDSTAHLYRRKDLDITVHFKGGRAWHIAYAKPFLADSEKAALLAENAGTAVWRRPQGDRVGNVLVWITENNSIVVTAFEIPNLMLFEVMTRACADELALQRDQRILAAQQAPPVPRGQPQESK